MKKPVQNLILSTLLVFLWLSPVTAQPEPRDDAIAEIASALNRIAAVMEKQLESGRLDLLMRRQDLSQRRLDRVEGQLASTRRSLQGHRQSEARLVMELERMNDAALVERMGWDTDSLEAQLASTQFELEASRGQIGELEATIARLEQEKARWQRELEDWQAFMDRELSGLQ